MKVTRIANLSNVELRLTTGCGLVIRWLGEKAGAVAQERTNTGAINSR